MYQNGIYVGLGLGDSSDEIRKIKAFMRAMYKSYAGGLEDTNLYDAAMTAVVSDMQNRLAASHKLNTGDFISGVINLKTKYAMGYLKVAPKKLPVFFTVEGHLSAWDVGPCAETARQMEREGLCRWQGVGYDNTSLPFNDRSGIAELDRLFSDYAAFPIGTPFMSSCFSQGSLVWCQFFLDYILNPSGKHNSRLKDWAGTLAHGNPMRQKDVNASWVPDGPKAGTMGIYKRHMTGTSPGELLYDRWREVNRTGDLYAENEDNEAGKNKTAVCVAVVDGDPLGLAQRLWSLASDFGEMVWPLAQSIISGVKFLTNMSPHGGYDLAPGMDWCRDKLRSIQNVAA